ncbi:glycosyltransferase [Rhodococcus sp. IEGM 1408]|uniref:glycosyltransferase n=1 Tax=Rhodococcus sp. IEGM 1408 TaxID=3082220 RepID=UPI002952F2C6|nr:glycosyltransferase [Rhodococcus sp. IEGM 1408]MDV8001442.1 glycosyltransferase [Rhodococcus sp. IEGM 1408]
MNGQLKILVILKTNEGGQWAIPQILELLRRGHNVSLVMPGGGGRLKRDADRERIEVLETNFQFAFSSPVQAAKGIAELRNLIVREKPDVLFYHLYASAIAARISSIRLRVKRVHMVAGPLYLESRPIRLAEKILVTLDDTLIAGSEYTYRAYKRLGGAGADWTTMIPYGTDCQRRAPAKPGEKSSLRTKLGFSETDFVVVFVAYIYSPKRALGQTIGLKGHEIAIEAWRKFSRENHGVKLVFIGSGFGAEAAIYRESLVSSTASEESITWITSVEDVSPWYKAADISISPSLSENHGAAMEAGAYGIPSIVSSAGGLPEMLPPYCGWVVQAGDCDELYAALNTALATRDQNGLEDQGREIRRHISGRYESSFCASAVASEIEMTASGRPISIFSEAHFIRDRYGRTFATDSVNTDDQWRRYSDVRGGVRVVARTDLRSSVPDGRPLEFADIDPIPDYLGSKGFVRSLSSLRRTVRRVTRAPGITVVRLPGPIAMVAAIGTFARGKPFAVELVGDVGGVRDSGVLPKWANFLPLVALTRFCVRKAAAVRYVTSTSLQNSFPSGGGVALSASDVVLDELYGDTEVRIRTSGSVNLLCVGSMANGYKGHEYAIEAVSLLRQNGHDAKLTIIGSGPWKHFLERVRSELGLDDHVSLPGAFGRREVVNAYDSADILLQPSLTEGMPRTVIEAMARGLPVVATEVGGSVELVDERLLVAPRDAGALASAVELLISSEDFFTEISAANLTRAHDFSGSAAQSRLASWKATLEQLARTNG